ncbi:hypothetical protein ACWZEH_21490 [Streptomyces sp. QTS137]
MSTAHVPQQSHRTGGTAPPDLPRVPPRASEVTRLLCGGVNLDLVYRDRVIEELYLHEQRIVAPSPGFDAARVLAHALRAQRRALCWSAAVLGLWAVGVLVTDGLLAALLLPGVLLGLVPWIKGRDGESSQARKSGAALVLWFGRLYFAVCLAAMIGVGFGAGTGGSGSDSGSSYGSYDPAYDSYDSSGSSGDVLGLGDVLFPLFTGAAGTFEPWQAWTALVFLVLIGLCVAGRRDQFARVFTEELSRRRFRDVTEDPAEQAGGERFVRLRDRIRQEQHAPLVMYDEASPFRGAGIGRDSWVLAVELRPDEQKENQEPLSNRAILDRIRPLIEQLRVPAESAGSVARDRLRHLEIDECVFLPVDKEQTDRAQALYTPQEIERHRLRAVEEGGEGRRHFLRIRVGGWEEELIVTVYVRVHTQGRMLMLEIAPHVMPPLQEKFKNVDRVQHEFRTATGFGRTVAAAVQVPGSVGRALIVLCGGLGYGWRLLTVGRGGGLLEGPALSVRELAAVGAGSTFQDMDVRRYLRSIQDRVGHGVRLALAEAGYETGEFVQKIVNISNGAVNINRVDGSTFAIGAHARAAAATTGGPAPRRGSSSNGTQ